MDKDKLKVLNRFIIGHHFLCEFPTQGVGLLVYTPEKVEAGFGGRLHITGTKEKYDPQVTYPGLKDLSPRNIFEYLVSMVVLHLNDGCTPSFHFPDKTPLDE